MDHLKQLLDSDHCPKKKKRREREGERKRWREEKKVDLSKYCKLNYKAMLFSNESRRLGLSEQEHYKRSATLVILTWREPSTLAVCLHFKKCAAGDRSCWNLTTAKPPDVYEVLVI